MNESPKILIAEDAPTQAEYLKYVLEENGFQILAAKDGEEAWKMVSREPVQLVISDIVMPKMDGYQLCRKIKEDPNRNSIPVILLTSLTDVSDVIKGLESLADSFITKPYEEKDLVRKIQNIISQNEAWKAQGREGETLDLDYLGKSYPIKSSRRQILNLLLSTFEAAVERNQGLNKANLRLKTLNEELEKFSYSISHDLRGPLRIIYGFSNIINEDFAATLGDKGKLYIQRIIEATKQMDVLIDALLGLSKVGQKEINQEEVDLTKMARDILSNLCQLDTGRKVNLNIADGVKARGDKNLLHAVLENLLRNAWKFTSKAEHTTIEFGQSLEGEEPVYYIKDNGVGFDMKNASKLFAPFQRFHPSSQFEGTGIGLATVQRIIARHNGRIWCESSPNQGTTFYFTL